jgi:hypothetical protein
MKRIDLFLIFIFFFLSGFSQSGIKCGTWRWDIKTITDLDGLGLLLKTPEPSSIDKLVKEEPPKVLDNSSLQDGKLPRYPDERQVVEIMAYVTLVKEEDDHDLHLVLKSPTSKRTMIGEIPDPACPTFIKFPQLKTLFTNARKDGANVWNMLNQTRKPVKVKVTGVVFWDAPHGQTGASKYGREIHPILKIEIQ